MSIFHEPLKWLAFALLDRRKTRGFHLMNDLRFWFNGRPVTMIFDVGANVGQTVQRMKEYFPHARIEAFEPILSTYAQLQRACAHFDDVYLHPVALGASSGQMQIRLVGETSLDSLRNTLLNPVGSADLLDLI